MNRRGDFTVAFLGFCFEWSSVNILFTSLFRLPEQLVQSLRSMCIIFGGLGINC